MKGLVDIVEGGLDGEVIMRVEGEGFFTFELLVRNFISSVDGAKRSTVGAEELGGSWLAVLAQVFGSSMGFADSRAFRRGKVDAAKVNIVEDGGKGGFLGRTRSKVDGGEGESLDADGVVDLYGQDAEGRGEAGYGYEGGGGERVEADHGIEEIEFDVRPSFAIIDPSVEDGSEETSFFVSGFNPGFEFETSETLAGWKASKGTRLSMKGEDDR